MSSIEVAKLSNKEKAELSCTYAAMILHDNNLEITALNIKKILQSSGIKIEEFWPNIFAASLKGQKVGNLILGGSGEGGKATEVIAKTDQEKAVAEKPKNVEKKKVEEKPKQEEEENLDMGDLFGF